MWPQMHFLDLQRLYMFWTAGVMTEHVATQKGHQKLAAVYTYIMHVYMYDFMKEAHWFDFHN